mgnify:FL=1
MSGEKCAQTRLSREAQESLARELALSQQIGAALARAASLVSRSERLVADLGRDVDIYMKGQLTEFQAKLETFRSRYRELQQLVGRITTSSRGEANRELVEEMRGLRAEAQRIQEDLEKLSQEIRLKEEQISKGLEGAINDHLRARLAAQRARRELVGLRAELEQRMDPAVFGSLQWVKGEAEALWRELAQKIEDPEGSIDEQDVVAYRCQLDDLIHRSEDLGRQDAQRRRVAKLLDQAFQNSGFRLTRSEELNNLNDPVRYQHEHPGPIMIRTSVPLVGPIDLWMIGPSGRDRGVLDGP